MTCFCKELETTDGEDLLTYEQCCHRLHNALQQKKHLAQTAEQLMRSRYSAFVVSDIDYIIGTTLPIQQAMLDQASIREWSEKTAWAGLEVVAHTMLGKRHAHVEFKAYFNEQNTEHYHHELSTFVKLTSTNKQDNTQNSKDEGAWYFIDPNALEQMQVTQKQPCICGSGEKFKRCCGKFL